MSTQQEFGKWRSFFWPVHAYELKKILPMFLMFFCISFNYTVLRDTKDTLLVNAPGSGAEAIPFIKFWVVLPSALLFMLIYAKLSNILSKQSLFYAVIAPFLVFFALFPTVLYPNKELLHPNGLADHLQSILPQGFSGMIALLRNWTFAVFYVMSELWGSVMLSLMFWGFANDVTKVSEAKRFYSLFPLGANLALICSGPLIYLLSKLPQKLGAGVDHYQISLNLLMVLAVGSGLLIIGCYWWMNKYVLTDPRFYDAATTGIKKKEKPKMSIKESFVYLAKSPYMGLLAILVIGYGIAINLVEVSWKGQLKMQYPNYSDYSAFMGIFSTITGIVTTLMILFAGSNIIRKFGWGVAALVTPVILLITGFLFFGTLMFKSSLGPLFALAGMTPLMFVVIVGTAQNILSKSSKYSLFDPTKEMAYIPLDQEQKVKGKAAIDVVGARLGKSGGSLIQQGLIAGFGSLALCTPYIAIILGGIVFAWILAAKALNKRFVALTSEPTDKASEPALKEAQAS